MHQLDIFDGRPAPARPPAGDAARQDGSAMAYSGAAAESTGLSARNRHRRENCRLIIADDNHLFRTSLVELLMHKGFTLVTTCCNGRELLGSLSTESCDLVLLDLHMPDIDGLYVLEAMRRSDTDAAVIVISGDSMLESAVGALRLGASDYVRKPYAPEMLLHTIDSVLRRRELERGQRKLAMNLERSERIHRFLVDTSPDLILTLDAQGRFTFANERIIRLLGFRPEELLNESFFMLVFDDDVDRARHALEYAAQHECSAEIRLVNQDKESHRHFEAQFIPVDFNDGFSLGDDSSRSAIYILARDITERRQANDRLAYLAYHDVLTGLPNRELFRDRVGLSIVQARRNSFHVATMFIDLDRFKLINDTFGHQQGDVILKEVAQRLLCELRKVDTLARIGGDEFTVLLPNISSRDDAGVVARKLIDSLAQPFSINGQLMFLSASIGISIYPDDGEDIETLMRHADIAMYHVKSHGKNDFGFFSQSMGEISCRRLTIENEIRQGIDKRHFELFYQLQVDAKTGDKVGVEALIRWHHPVKGLVTAGSFIPVVEEIGLMPVLTAWVIDTACRDLRRWWDAGLGIRRVSVNVPPSVLASADFVERLLETLERHAIPCRNFEIEVTENTFIGDRDKVADQLRRVAQHGISIAIDDFGTQYSSLSYLRHLPITTLKIDQSFVREIQSVEDKSTIVRAIIGIAEGLGLNVIAEGVETVIQAEFLRQIGCHMIQGYLFGRPVPFDAIAQALAPLSETAVNEVQGHASTDPQPSLV